MATGCWSKLSWLVLVGSLIAAPLRVALAARGPAAIVEVDGRRCGYVGRSPMSGNLEYWIDPWARGGVGRQAIAAFVRSHRTGDKPRRFVISRRNACLGRDRHRG